jgi:hypothetical protein
VDGCEDHNDVLKKHIQPQRFFLKIEKKLQRDGKKKKKR